MYMAPEIFSLSNSSEMNSEIELNNIDMYSLGIITYQMMCKNVKRVPFINKENCVEMNQFKFF